MLNLCACGCGTPTSKSRGGKRTAIPSGQYHKYAPGHHMLAGIEQRATKSYRARKNPHGSGGTLLVHRQRAERALGKPLPRKSVVHHADGSRNEHAQLVICENQAYHGLLHVRMRVKSMGGNPNTDRICVYCKEVKAIDQFIAFSNPKLANRWHCRACSRARHRQKKAA